MNSLLLTVVIYYAKAEKQKKLVRALGAGAVLAPASVGIYKSSAEKKDIAPIVAGAGVGALPVAHGISSGALRLRDRGFKQFTDPERLARQMKPGDILLTGHESALPFKAKDGKTSRSRRI